MSGRFDADAGTEREIPADLVHPRGWISYNYNDAFVTNNMVKERFSGNLDFTYYMDLGGEHAWKAGVQFVGDDTLSGHVVAMGIGGALLAFSGTLPVAVVFALVAGFGMGAFSPLQGIMSEELFDRRTLGAMMGFYGSVLLLAGSVGPVLAGVLAETTGDRRWAPAVVVAATIVAAGAQALARRESHCARD